SLFLATRDAFHGTEHEWKMIKWIFVILWAQMISVLLKYNISINKKIASGRYRLNVTAVSSLKWPFISSATEVRGKLGVVLIVPGLSGTVAMEAQIFSRIHTSMRILEPTIMVDLINFVFSLKRVVGCNNLKGQIFSMYFQDHNTDIFLVCISFYTQMKNYPDIDE
ncbi:hypothetical protein ACJX0J_027826, partial [Zea mays]